MDIATGLGLISGAVVLVTLILMGGELGETDLVVDNQSGPLADERGCATMTAHDHWHSSRNGFVDDDSP